MPKQKRTTEDGSPQKQKKAKLGPKNAAEPEARPSTLLSTEEIDFPRGGGSSFTPAEYKAIRAEALEEAKSELVLKDSAVSKSKKKGRRSIGLDDKKKSKSSEKNDGANRVEHLNYKRIATGMKLLCQVMSIHPLGLIVSLPNQLLAHIPITQISSQLTELLESVDRESVEEPETDEDDEEEKGRGIPDLEDMFKVGQYLRAVVTGTKPAGVSDGIGVGRSRDDVEKRSRRVELSISPKLVNAGLRKDDLGAGLPLTASIQSKEDHGYIVDLGVSDITAFLSFKGLQKPHPDDYKSLPLGHVLDVIIEKAPSKGRTCTVKSDRSLFASNLVDEKSNVTSLFPGSLVNALVTAVLSAGLNVQILGSFPGTISTLHMQPGTTYKVGQKLKARVLYDVLGTSPTQYTLSVLEHVVKLEPKKSGESSSNALEDSYPIGTVFESTKVVEVEPEQGLLVECGASIRGFVHISQVSDEHVPTLSSSSGSYKLGSSHRARVTGCHPFDGLLQLSLRQSVLEQKFLQVSDVQVGENIRGTIKKLSDIGLFVSISGNVDAVVWPNHYADIRLKHPQKRFKVGGTVKCRVLTVDPERRRIALTAKKTLVESDLPIISSAEEAKVGTITHGVVFKILEKSLLVEFYNNVKSVVPQREACDTPTPLSEQFFIGKPVKVKILSVEPTASKIVSSIRQASQESTPATTPDVSAVEVGQVVSGSVTAVHKDNAILNLDPSSVKAFLSLNNLANARGISVSQLRASLKAGEPLEDLLIVNRNVERAFVIVANRPQAKVRDGGKTPEVGAIVEGKVLRHDRQGAIVKIPGKLNAVLHITDLSDQYNETTTLPPVGMDIKAVVVAVDKRPRRLYLSMRPSRLNPDADGKISDREIENVDDLKPGASVRGFVKNVADNGVFVCLGRQIDARVQIKELYDEYVKDWKSGFDVNALVKGKIISVDTTKKQMEMSFRTKDSGKSKPSNLTLSDLEVGQKIEGCVKKVEEYGIFITISGSNITGLCHKSEIADNAKADVNLALRSFHEGDNVKAVILAIDKEKKKINLSIKPSHFSEEDLMEVDESESESAEPSEEMEQVEAAAASQSDTDAESSNDEEQMEATLSLPTTKDKGNHSAKPVDTPALDLSTGFRWSNQNQADDDKNQISASEGESDEDEDGQTKKRKKRKEIELDLTADMHTKIPQSTADFERHLLSSPNSSYMWIQYMSFQLQLSEVEKAREVGRRALKAINFREELEKLNVWIALLNLENTYGTDESIEALFKDAARHNDSKTIHLRMAAIFDESQRHEKAEEQYKRTCKKFGASCKVWTLFGEHYFRQNKSEDARKLLPRSLQSLEKRKHIKCITKFAQMEYKLADPERGKTIFEGIADSHPKRWDLWSIYIDMEAGQKDIQSVRNIFDRVLAMKMTSHKAKAFFKKWLELERRIGDEEGADAVKAKAIEWTQRAAASS